MTSREFCYWLQGFFEIGGTPEAHEALDASKVATIKRHLALVFKHEIDPSYPNQPALNAIHAGQVPGSFVGWPTTVPPQLRPIDDAPKPDSRPRC